MPNKGSLAEEIQSSVSMSQIIACMAAGQSKAQIARDLGISTRLLMYMLKPSRKVYRFIRERAGYKCESCQCPLENGDIHHIIPTLLYNDPTNLRYLCRSCHMSVEVRRYVATKRRDRS